MFVYIVDSVYILIIKGALLMELQKNMIITNEESTYRVLALTDEQALVIDIATRKMPSWEKIDDFTEWISIENLTQSTSLSPKAEQVANRRYSIIAPIIPFVGNEKLRAELIAETAIANNLSKATIRKYLCNYLAEGISALAPKEQLTDKPLSTDEKNFRKSLNKWFFTTKKRTLKSCYTLMLEKYYCDEEGKLLDNVPSYYQFRYFYRKYKKPSTEMISRNSLSYYQRNQRPLVGDGVQGFAGTIGMGMLDSTITNCYLVNDANELIGRAVLTICVDAYSGMICGYSLSWKGGIYSIRDLMLNIITDKVEHCKKYGIDIEQFQWDCKQLPLTFVTDKGSEYAGMNFENISELGISIINLKSYRADSKGSVEVAFNALDTYMKPYLLGKGYIEPDFQERGVHDYRKDACLTLYDFEKILLHCIIFYNSSRIIEEFRMTEEMLADNLKPIPCHIWKWAGENLGSNLVSVDKEKLMLTLLPRTTAKFTRKGLAVNGLHYHNKLYREAYLEGKECEVAYDPDSSSRVWMLENGAYIQFDIIESRFKDKSLEAVSEMKAKQRELVKSEQRNKTQAEIDLARSIKLITDNAQKIDNLSTKYIRENRKKEAIKTHKNHVKEVGL